jgi:vacuolar protein sorting-associated protein 51
MLNRSNTHQARSQFLENHLAKLFEQKMEIFTKVEYTQVPADSLVLLEVKSCYQFLVLITES